MAERTPKDLEEEAIELISKLRAVWRSKERRDLATVQETAQKLVSTLSEMVSNFKEISPVVRKHMILLNSVAVFLKSQADETVQRIGTSLANLVKATPVKESLGILGESLSDFVTLAIQELDKGTESISRRTQSSIKSVLSLLNSFFTEIKDLAKSSFIPPSAIREFIEAFKPVQGEFSDLISYYDKLVKSVNKSMESLEKKVTDVKNVALSAKEALANMIESFLRSLEFRTVYSEFVPVLNTDQINKQLDFIEKRFAKGIDIVPVEELRTQAEKILSYIGKYGAYLEESTMRGLIDLSLRINKLKAQAEKIYADVANKYSKLSLRIVPDINITQIERVVSRVEKHAGMIGPKMRDELIEALEDFSRFSREIPETLALKIESALERLRKLRIADELKEASEKLTDAFTKASAIRFDVRKWFPESFLKMFKSLGSSIKEAFKAPLTQVLALVSISSMLVEALEPLQALLSDIVSVALGPLQDALLDIAIALQPILYSLGNLVGALSRIVVRGVLPFLQDLSNYLVKIVDSISWTIDKLVLLRNVTDEYKKVLAPVSTLLRFLGYNLLGILFYLGGLYVSMVKWGTLWKALSLRSQLGIIVVTMFALYTALEQLHEGWGRFVVLIGVIGMLTTAVFKFANALKVLNLTFAQIKPMMFFGLLAFTLLEVFTNPELSTGLKILIGGISLLSIAIALLTVKTWALNVAMAANPIGLVIMAISALILLVVELVHWITGHSPGLIPAFKALGDVVIGIINAVFKPLVSIVEIVTTFVKDLFTKFIDSFKSLKATDLISISAGLTGLAGSIAILFLSAPLLTTISFVFLGFSFAISFAVSRIERLANALSSLVSSVERLNTLDFTGLRTLSMELNRFNFAQSFVVSILGTIVPAVAVEAHPVPANIALPAVARPEPVSIAPIVNALGSIKRSVDDAGEKIATSVEDLASVLVDEISFPFDKRIIDKADFVLRY